MDAVPKPTTPPSVQQRYHASFGILVPVCDPPSHCPRCLALITHPPVKGVITDQTHCVAYLKMAFPDQIREIERDAVERAVATKTVTRLGSQSENVTALPSHNTRSDSTIEDAVMASPQVATPAPSVPSATSLIHRLSKTPGNIATHSSSNPTGSQTKPLVARVTPAVSAPTGAPTGPFTMFSYPSITLPPTPPAPTPPPPIVTDVILLPRTSFKILGVARDTTWLETVRDDDIIARQIIGEAGQTFVHRYLRGRTNNTSPVIRVRPDDPVLIKKYMWSMNVNGGSIPPEVNSHPFEVSRLDLRQLDGLVWIKKVTPHPEDSWPEGKTDKVRSNVKFLVYNIAIHDGLFEAYHTYLPHDQQQSLWLDVSSVFISQTTIDRLPRDESFIGAILDCRKSPAHRYFAMYTLSHELSYRGMYPDYWNNVIVPLARNYFAGGKHNYAAFNERKPSHPDPSPLAIGTYPFDNPPPAPTTPVQCSHCGSDPHDGEPCDGDTLQQFILDKMELADPEDEDAIGEIDYGDEVE